MQFNWEFDAVGEDANVDWDEVSNLYRIAPLGNKPADDLRTVFGNSRYTCFVFTGEADNRHLVGVGRALADGLDCSYICDVAVHPECQGMGLGKDIVRKLMSLSAEHKKIILYANPGKEGFYQRLGFKRMLTAMAAFKNAAHAVEVGLVVDEE